MNIKNEHENMKLKKELVHQQRKISELLKLKIAPNTINLIVNNSWKQSEIYKSLITEHKKIVKNGDNNINTLKQWQTKHDQAYNKFAGVLGLNNGQLKNNISPHKAVLIKNNSINNLKNHKVKESKIKSSQKQDESFKFDGKTVREDIKLLKTTKVTPEIKTNSNVIDKASKKENKDQIEIPKSINFLNNKRTKNSVEKDQTIAKTVTRNSNGQNNLIKLVDSKQIEEDFVVDLSKRPSFVEKTSNENKIKTIKKIKKVSKDSENASYIDLTEPRSKPVKITNVYYEENYEMIYDENKRPSLSKNKSIINIQLTPFNSGDKSKTMVNKFTDEFEKLDAKKKKRYERWVQRKNRKIAKKLIRKNNKISANFSQSNFTFTNFKSTKTIENISPVVNSFETQNNHERNERIAALNSLRKKYADNTNKDINENESYGTRYFKAISKAIKEETTMGLVNQKIGNHKK